MKTLSYLSLFIAFTNLISSVFYYLEYGIGIQFILTLTLAALWIFNSFSFKKIGKIMEGK